MSLESHRVDLGLLALRVGAGGVLIAHGAQKLFGWFGGGGLEATGEAMESMGFKPGKHNALAAGLAETGGGALLAAGVATPLAGAVGAGGMAGAVAVHVPLGFFNQSGGAEHPGFLGWACAALAIAGPGRYSLDHLSSHRFNQPWLLGMACTGTALVTAVMISRRSAELRARSEEFEPDDV